MSITIYHNPACGKAKTPFRRAYIRSIVDEVQVDDEQIRIVGRKTVLERLVTAEAATSSGVPSFVREWRRSQSGANESQWRRSK